MYLQFGTRFRVYQLELVARDIVLEEEGEHHEVLSSDLGFQRYEEPQDEYEDKRK